MILDQFKFLTPAELVIVEQHLKLGMAHLKQYLSESELKRLLGSLSSNQIQKSKIGESNIEISGNLSLVLNTIFTAIFGAWMGYSGFWGFNLDSVWVFGCIVAVAACVGVFIGYQNIKLTKQQAIEAVNNQKFKLLQVEILKKIDQKRKEEVDAIVRQLNDLFADLSLETPFKEKVFDLNLAGKSKNEISKWIGKVEAMGKEKLEARFSGLVLEEWTEEWREIHEELRQNITSFFEEKGELEVIHSKSQRKKEEILDSSLKKLISTLPKKSAKPLPWISSNIRSLIVGLAPTVLGGFSSLSVYLGGVPVILKNFGYDEAFIFFTNPKVKAVEFVISFLITLYFGFSFVYTHRNMFKRFQELEKTNKSIIQMESSLTVLDANMLKLKEVKKSSLQLMRFFKILDKISEYSPLGT